MFYVHLVDGSNPNVAFDRTAGSHTLATAGQRGRSPHMVSD
jgi:hypothetical protein